MRAVATLLALLLLVPARAASQGGATELLPRLDLHTPEARAAAARALAALGPAEMQQIFALVSPAAAGPQDETLAHSFALQPQGELHAFLGRFTRDALSAERLRPALLVLREAGAARELARCLELAAGSELQPELVSALRGILERDPAACGSAFASALTAASEDAECLAHALAQARKPETLRALARLAAQRTELAPLCCACLLGEADALPRPADPDLLGALRELLASEEHPAAPELLLLAGRLDDDEAVPLLIERLASARPALCANALWSLRRITGLGLGADAQAWSQWFRDESQWWKERAPAVLPMLHGDDAGAQRRALGELGARYWHRQQVASEIGEYLAHSHAEGARMACGLLAHLGCPSAVPLLQARLEDTDPAVRESARAALASLNGKNVPSRRVGMPAAPRPPPAR